MPLTQVNGTESLLVANFVQNLSLARVICKRAAPVCRFASRCRDKTQSAAEFGVGCSEPSPYHQLLPLCRETKRGCGSLPADSRGQAGRCAAYLPPPCLRPSLPEACSALPAGCPCSDTMADRIKVTFLAVTVADNLSHEFNMP